MKSVSDQFVSQISWQSFYQAKDLHKKVIFTLLALFVYRLGTYIPLPGINPQAMKTLAQEYSGRGILSMLNMISGGALERMGIFALNLMPYISSSIIIQLMGSVSPYLAALKKEGESGKHKLTQYTRYGTILLSLVQGASLISVLSMQSGVVYESGPFFYAAALSTIAGSTLFLMWMGEQITARGIGNGSSMIIYAGIMANLPGNIIGHLQQARMGNAVYKVLLSVLCASALIAFIIFMEQAYRKVIIEYPQMRIGQKIGSKEKSYIPLKLNPSGVLPPIFAATLIGFFKILGNASWLDTSRYHFSGYTAKVISFFSRTLALLLSDSNMLGVLCHCVLIMIFCVFYTSIVFNTEETSENLRKSGAFIPGHRPGLMTKKHLDGILSRITVVGAMYIAFIATLPAILNILFHFNFPFQGTSILISVSITLDIISHIHSYIISHQYKTALNRRSTIRGKNRK